MSQNLAIVFGKKIDFRWDSLDAWLLSKGFSKQGSSGKPIYRNTSLSLSLTDYDDKIVVQGKLTTDSRDILVKLSSISTLLLDGKSQKEYLEIFTPENGKIICPHCMKTNSFVTSVVDHAQNVRFIGECGHEINTSAPLLISRGRILPDLNRLISRSTSKMIRQGFFNSFEFVIPEYYDHYVDTCFAASGAARAGYLKELEDLKELDKIGKIRIYSYPFNGTIDEKECQREGQIEDDITIGIAQRTQSLILSADKTVIQKLRSLGLDGILIEGKFDQAMKVNAGSEKRGDKESK